MDLRAALAAHRLVAIVRGGDPEAALRTVLAMADEGIELIEVSLSGKDALSVIKRAREALGPDRPLGAGTVLTADDARAPRRAGANFAVTPALGEGVGAAHALGLPVLAGVMTPTEILAARTSGAAALKIFPAAQAGGPAYLKALRGPFRTNCSCRWAVSTRRPPGRTWLPEQPRSESVRPWSATPRTVAA